MRMSYCINIEIYVLFNFCIILSSHKNEKITFYVRAQLNFSTVNLVLLTSLYCQLASHSLECTRDDNKSGK
jgi:uncharacterized protein YcgL (UPF0745 family)